MEYNESEIMNLISESSEEAREILYEKYKYLIEAIIKKYIYTATKLGLEYKDLFQEALVGFTDAMNQFDSEKNASFKTFASLCTERRIQNIIAKAGRNKNKIMVESLSLDHTYEKYKLPLKEIISDQSENDPLENITKQEEIDELVESVKKELSDREIEVFQFMLNGLAYKDIALLLNKTPKQIDNTMQRIKNKIKIVLENRKEEFE